MAMKPLASASVGGGTFLAFGDRDHQLGSFGRQRPALGDFFAPRPWLRRSALPVSTTRSTMPRASASAARKISPPSAMRRTDLRAEAAHRALRAGPAGHDADRGFGEAELDLRFGDAEIAGDRQFQPAAQRMAGQHGDGRLPQPRQPVEDAMAVAHPLHLEIGGAHLRPGLDIAAGAKALAFAAEQHDAHAVRRLGLVERRFQRAQHRDVERVEFFRPAQRDDADGAVLLEGDEALSHARLQARRRHCSDRPIGRS